MIAGGAAMLVFGLALDWASFAPQTMNDAFDYFFTGGIAYLLVVAAGLVAFVFAAGWIKPRTNRWPLILLLATAVAVALMVLRLILGAGEEPGLGNLDRSSGMYMSFLAAAVAFVGAVINFRATEDDDDHHHHHLEDADARRDVSRSSERRSEPPAP
jgi:hypothetical protein